MLQVFPLGSIKYINKLYVTCLLSNYLELWIFCNLSFQYVQGSRSGTIIYFVKQHIYTNILIELSLKNNY